MTLKSLFGFTFIGVFSNAILMLSSVLFIRIYSPELVGNYFYIVFLASLIGNLTLFGNATYLNKHFSDGDDNKTFSKIGIFLILSCVSLISVLFITVEDLTWYLILFIVIDAGTLKIYKDRFLISYLRSTNKIAAFSVTLIGASLVRLFITLIALKFDLNIKYVVIGYMACSLLFVCVNFSFTKKVSQRFRDAHFRAYFNDGRPYFIATIFTMTYDYLPVLYLKYFLNDPVEVAFYVSSYKIVSVFIIGLGVFAQVFLQYQRRIFLETGSSRAAVDLSMKFIFLSFLMFSPVFIVVNLYSEELMMNIFGLIYGKANNVLKWQILCIWGSIINFIGFSTLQSIDKQKLVPRIIAPFSLLNIILSIYLVRFGAEGVSASFAISILCSATITLCVLIAIRRRVLIEI